MLTLLMDVVTVVIHLQGQHIKICLGMNFSANAYGHVFAPGRIQENISGKLLICIGFVPRGTKKTVLVLKFFV